MLVIDTLSCFEVALKRDDVTFEISRIHVIVTVGAARSDCDRCFSVEFQNSFWVVIDTFTGACSGENDFDFDRSFERHDEFESIVMIWERCVRIERFTVQSCIFDLTENIRDSGCDYLELINACHASVHSRALPGRSAG